MRFWSSALLCWQTVLCQFHFTFSLTARDILSLTIYDPRSVSPMHPHAVRNRPLWNYGNGMAQSTHSNWIELHLVRCPTIFPDSCWPDSDHSLEVFSPFKFYTLSVIPGFPLHPPHTFMSLLTPFPLPGLLFPHCLGSSSFSSLSLTVLQVKEQQ
jgi:hypothetical protein